MSKEPQPQIVERSTALRQELKAWEKAFAAANNGRKASRDDIKNDRAIASKYKEYNKLRDRLSGKTDPPPESVPSTTYKKRKVPGHEDPQTPRRKVLSTPPRDLHPADLDPYDSPLSVRKWVFYKEPVTFIGPTPQKNGIVLGLFDLLEEEMANSPSKRQRGSPVRHISSNVLMTPRKGGASVLGTPPARTPASSSKRRLFDAFTTPLKQTLVDTNHSGSSSRSHFSTPAFLRRDKQGPPPILSIGEDGEPIFATPVIRMPPKPLFKGLSTMIADLRKIEEEALDDEIDILNELDRGASGGEGKPAAFETKTSSKGLAKDSQPLFDDEGFFRESKVGESDKEGEDEKPQLGRDGNPLKVWKKRGQKRTTRMFTLRPSRVKPKHTSEKVVNESDSAGELEKEQPISSTPSKRTRDGVEDSHRSNVEGSDFEEGSRDRTPKKRRKVNYPTSSKPDEKKLQITESTPAEKENLIKKTVKKISSQANANYRRLKLRNKNSKGAGGGGGRFGRKRR